VDRKIRYLKTVFPGLIRLPSWGRIGKIPVMAISLPAGIPRGNPKLLDQVRDVIRRKHYSIRTEQTYTEWIRRFILFHGKRHPSEMGESEVRKL
jgi:hypothetical protein